MDRDPHPYGFPDIALGQFGVEVKFTIDDTWRTVANSVFERHRAKGVKYVYVVMAKMGGKPEVKWGRYEASVMHVRTSHVPRFEIELGTTDTLFAKFGITYKQFSEPPADGRMKYLRDHARVRLKRGEPLWWPEETPNGGQSPPVHVELFANPTTAEKLKMRGETSLLCSPAQ